MGPDAGRLARLAPLLKLLFAIVAVLAVAYAIRREREGERRLWEAHETQRLARRGAKAVAWGALGAAGDAKGALAVCRELWQGELGLNHDPVALAYTRDELTAYFVVGADSDSLRQVRCDANGVRRGDRVVHPLLGHLPAEAPKPTGGEEGSEWVSELRSLAAQPLAAGEDGFELLGDAPRDRVLQRRWRKAPGGSRPTLLPPDAPAFARLAASARVVPESGAAPPALQALRRHDWLAEPDAALELVARCLPAGARVSEISIEKDSLELQIEAPTPAFDGRPPAPFGEKRFDEYGVAETDWWYPREIPGFGCSRGQDVAAVRAALAAARAGSARLASAWFSCSPAYGDGRTGRWHLQQAR